MLEDNNHNITALLQRILALLERDRVNKYDFDYLDNADMKQLFKVCDKTLHRWRKKDLVPHCKQGGRCMYSRRAIIGILEARLGRSQGR